MAKRRQDKDQDKNADTSSPQREAGTGITGDNLPLPSTLITPSKPDNKRIKITIWHYTLNDESTHVCRDEFEAEYFGTEYENVIQDVRTFQTDKEYMKFLASTKKNSTTTKEKANKQVEKINIRSKEKAKKIIEDREKHKPKPKLQLLYKTNPFCTKAFVIVLYMAPKGTPLFYAKPKNLNENTKSYIRELGYDDIGVQRDQSVEDMIFKMTHYRLRDHDSGPDSIVTTLNKKNNKKYQEEVTVTELDIPSDIHSLTEEKLYIENKLKLFADTIVKLQKTDTFKCVLENDLHENIFKWMYEVTYTFNDWLRDAVIEIEECTNLNSYITLEDVNKIKLIMAQNMCKPRYPPITPTTTPIKPEKSNASIQTNEEMKDTQNEATQSTYGTL